MQLVAFTSTLEKTHQAPTEIKVLPWGVSEYDEGRNKLVVGSVSVSAIPANQKKYNFDRVALDFNHNSVPKKDKDGKEIPLEEPVKIAAYGTVEVRENDGMYLTNLEWTSEGKVAFEGGHYCDISPTVLHDEHGNVTFVHSVALCRQGRIPGLTLFGVDFLVEEKSTTNTNKIMDDPQKLKALLFAILGLPEDADEETALAAAKKFADKHLADDETKPAELEKFSTELGDVSKRLATLEKAGADTAKLAVYNSAIAEGKLVPNSALKLSLEDLKEFCAGLPAEQLPLNQRTPEGIKNFSATKPLNADATNVCKQLGISDETFNKYNS